MTRVFCLLGLVGVALLGSPGGARASDTLESVSQQLMDPCDHCKGKLLAACDCGPAADLKREVQRMLDAGRSEGEIVDSMVVRYGPWIRANPDRSGFNLVVHYAPWALLAAGLGLLVVFLRRVVAPAPRLAAVSGREIAAAPGASLHGSSNDESYRRRLEAELRELDRS